MSEPKIAKAGKLLCVDSGVHSGYISHGFFVVLRDFDPHAELAAHLDANPAQREAYHFEEESFLAALLARGLLLELEYGTMYLTSYSSHEEFRFMPGVEGNV